MTKFRCQFVLAVAALAACACALAQSNSARRMDYAPWNRVLQQSLTPSGLVNYAGLKAEPAELDAFISEVRDLSPVSNPRAFPGRREQMAYWINAYNALVISGVVRAWPTSSVRAIGLLPFAFFWQKKFTVGGHPMTLNDIEHGTLRKQFGDPRIHFALNCASLSCPLLRQEPYLPDKLDSQLDDAARSFLNSNRGIQLDTKLNRVFLSRIFKWYSEDFDRWAKAHAPGAQGPPQLVFVRGYLNPERRNALDSMKNPRLEFMDYDWRINATHSPK